MRERRLRLLCVAWLLVAAGAASADDDSCRQWQREHCEWTARVVSRYLSAAPQREIDEAVFEVLQRETYLTSCQEPVASSRRNMVGWRLMDRQPDEYGSAVLEALLDRSGFDVALRDQLGAESLDVGHVAQERSPGFGARWQRNGTH